MRTEFDQKRADRDAILYETDGRLFDLVESSERLEIVARPLASVLRNWGVVAAILLTSPVILLVSLGTLPTWQRYALVIAAGWAFEIMLQKVARRSGYLEPNRWIVDKNDGQFYADEQQVTRLEEIVALRAVKSRWEIPWRTPKRFRLSAHLRDGRQIRLGLWTFARREWAWRQDAAQIARFLNVPLEFHRF